VIRQAISCDICGAEKKQTNHWFVAYENGGELRVSGWSSRNRLHPGTKHLCGQTCLHKLVDDFMARTLAARLQPVAANVVEEPVAGTDTSLTSASAYVDEVESSARLLTPPAPVLPKRSPFVVPAERVAGPGKFQVEECAPPFEDSPRYASRNWHAEAWDRERERELRAVERRPDIAVRRRSNA
jgi:hypothetical protein